METAQLERNFDRDGFAIVRGAIGSAAIGSMLTSLWQALAKRHGLQRDDPDTWNVERPSGLQSLRRSEALAPMVAPALRSAIDALLGAGRWDCPRSGVGAIPCFPRPGAQPCDWDVPATIWHTDYPGRGNPGPRFGAKALATLERLEPRGGGTLVVSGSHRLVAKMVAEAPVGDRGHSADLRRRMARRDPWLRDLMSKKATQDRIRRFMDEGGEVDGIPLRVVEFTGEAGDVLLFHPWMMHGLAPNCSETPRMVVATSFTTPEGTALYAPAAE